MKRAFVFLRRHVVPALLCFAAAMALMQTTLLRRIENLTRDERTRLRAALGVTVAPDDLAVVAIDETSIRENGRWPWSREVHGSVLQLLSRVRPAVVTWDILFTEATPADDYFAKAIALNRAVVLGAMRVDDPQDGATPAQAAAAGVRLLPLTHVVGDPSRIPSGAAMTAPGAPLGQVAAIGFVDMPPESDGVVRSAPLVVRIGDQVFPTLSLRTLMEYWSASADDVTVRLGDAIVIDAPLAHRRIPIDEAGGYAINYRHGRAGFATYGYTTLWTGLNRRYVEKKPALLPGLTGRMLLVGQEADGLSDFGPTPLEPLTPLVLVHANVIENVLREDYTHPVSAAWVWCGAFLIGVAGLARFSDRGPLPQAVFAIGIPVAFLMAATLAWINGSWILPVVGPVVGFVALQVFMIVRRMLTEQRAKEQIRGMFGTYVSPELVSRMVAAGKPPELGGHEAEITAYFSDIEGFSTFSEQLAPERLVRLMNDYLTVCTDTLQEQGGTLDKYIGDAVVAMYGAPLSLRDHAYRACLTVIRVQERVDALRARWQAEGGWPELVSRLRTRIGLNSGPCIIGNVGSRTRFNYTMMGDNVNLAARMESGAKSWGVYAMCADATRLAAEAQAPGAVVFRPLGRIRVKGRMAAVPIHEVVGLKGGVPDRTLECIAVFSDALDRYHARDWDGATAGFERSARLEPRQPGGADGVKSNPSTVYLGIVAQQRQSPPPPDWDGVYIMKEK